MNTANLQLEGVLIALAEINRLLVSKGVLSKEEVALALRRAESSLTSEDRPEEVSLANIDAIVFPVRLLQLANSSDEEIADFSKLARLVAERKAPHNGQRQRRGFNLFHGWSGASGRPARSQPMT